MQSISASSTPEHVGQQDVRSEHARSTSRYSVGRRPCRALVVLRAPWPRCCGAASAIVRCSSTTRLSPRSSSALHVSGENGIAHAVSRPSSRPCHLSMNAAVRSTASAVGVARQRERRLAVGHALAHDDADAGVLVGLQAGVGELGAARDRRSTPSRSSAAPRCRAATVTYSSSSVIAVCRLKTWFERARRLVREDAAHGVGVADVHVAVEEARA